MLALRRKAMVGFAFCTHPHTAGGCSPPFPAAARALMFIFISARACCVRGDVCVKQREPGRPDRGRRGGLQVLSNAAGIRAQPAQREARGDRHPGRAAYAGVTAFEWQRMTANRCRKPRTGPERLGALAYAESSQIALQAKTHRHYVPKTKTPAFAGVFV